jgi:tetratricopeptide (TPR) repeat protein
MCDQAIQELQKARGELSRQTDVLTWIGHCFAAKKNLRMAKRHYEDALVSIKSEKKEDGLKDLRYRLGRIGQDMGDPEAAIQHYEELAAMDYGYRDVAQRLEALTSSEATGGTDESIPMD